VTRIAQLGIAIGALGAIITIMGLFPVVTGLPPTAGIGLVQIFTVLIGYTLLIWGALIYVKFTFYSFSHSNLAQQIGTRLALTGLVLAAMTALADVLGFGSHGFVSGSAVFLGKWQAAGIIINFLLSAMGVLIYAITGDIDPNSR
jgi:hypothetical protein